MKEKCKTTFHSTSLYSYLCLRFIVYLITKTKEYRHGLERFWITNSYFTEHYLAGSCYLHGRGNICETWAWYSTSVHGHYIRRKNNFTLLQNVNPSGTDSYRQTYNISRNRSKNVMFLLSSCSCLRPIPWSRVLSREWWCSWSSTDRPSSNYICVINNFIAYWGATYFRVLTVGHL